MIKILLEMDSPVKKTAKRGITLVRICHVKTFSPLSYIIYIYIANYFKPDISMVNQSILKKHLASKYIISKHTYPHCYVIVYLP